MLLVSTKNGYKWLFINKNRLECEYLDNNLLNCLKEKSVADNVTKMTCKPEYVIIALFKAHSIQKLNLTFWFFAL